MTPLDPTVVGYRFHPTDEELIYYYLKNKLIGNEARVQAIPEVNILKFEPEDLPKLSVIKLRDHEWFFFSEMSSITCRRSKRATGHGFWKITGKDRAIKAEGSKETTGIKKTLVFYRGKVPNGLRTNWVIHEYHAPRTFPRQRELVLIKLKKKVDKDEKMMNSPCNKVEHGNDVSVTSDMATEINTTPEVQGNGETSFESTFPLPNVDFPSPGYHNEVSMDQSLPGDNEQLPADDDIYMPIDSVLFDQWELVQQLEHNVAKIDASLEAQGNAKEPISNYTSPGYSNGINMDPSQSGDNEQQPPEDDRTKFFISFPVDQLEMVQSQDRDNEKLVNDDRIAFNAIGYEYHEIFESQDRDNEKLVYDDRIALNAISYEDREIFYLKDFGDLFDLFQGDGCGQEEVAPSRPWPHHHR